MGPICLISHIGLMFHATNVEWCGKGEHESVALQQAAAAVYHGASPASLLLRVMFRSALGRYVNRDGNFVLVVQAALRPTA
jgi:hypothetical protein